MLHNMSQIETWHTPLQDTQWHEFSCPQSPQDLSPPRLSFKHFDHRVVQTSSPVVCNSGLAFDEASRQKCQSPLSVMMSDTEKGT